MLSSLPHDAGGRADAAAAAAALGAAAAAAAAARPALPSAAGICRPSGAAEALATCR